jgi:WD40 repeat protein/mono/diheme cytochrome c family protein
MQPAAASRLGTLPLLVLALAAFPAAGGEPDRASLARQVQGILQANCHRCHGRDGAIEGGFNYLLDLDKLVARKKVVPGQPEASPLYKRVVAGKMPPPGEQPRPTAAEVAVLEQWIRGAGPLTAAAPRPFLGEAEVSRLILADLEKVEKRSRRFTRYFSLAHLYNLGFGADELQTYRNALAKLLNSLSWHPRLSLPVAVDPARTLLRIDLRDFQWDANLWNRILAEYPYGVLQDTATARAVSVATASRLPVVRADWFVATASRPPLYQDLLQLPTNSAELERQLRVDVLLDIQQERVARAGFNGSGISRNNRILERHDAVHGAYWRTYDFDAVPQNLVDRQNLLPDRRNVFAYPLGPGISESLFLHAGGEIIFNLPNGLQAYMLVNKDNQRIDKGPIAIVSDPKRPDRAVETGVSCMSCHYRGILPKDDQVRDYADKNPKAFSRADAELVRALYVPQKKMRGLMDEDAERFRKALEKTGNKVTAAEPVMAITLRYEADVDLPTVAAEAGLTPAEFTRRLAGAAALAPNLGSLKVPGGTVHRQVLLQSFGDVVKEMRLGTLLQSGQVAVTLPDNTGELDPLEAQSGVANSLAFSADGKLALQASADKTLRLWDVENEREIRRFIGHSASVWSVAFTPDGTHALSGGADHTVRLWEVETGREQRRLEGHTGLVTALAVSADGKKALSGGYDHTLILWDLETGTELRRWEDAARYINALALTADGRRAFVAAEDAVLLLDLGTGKEVRSFDGHTDTVTCLALSADGRYLLTGSDDHTVRLWDAEAGRIMRSFMGHTGFVKSVAFSPDGRLALSGGADQTVRLWAVETGKELGRFAAHEDAIAGVTFTPDGKASLSGSRDGAVRVWDLKKALGKWAGAAPRPVEAPAESVRGPAAASPSRVAVIPVGGTVSHLFLSPDGKWLYYLNLTDGKAGRVDAVGLKRVAELRLADGAEVLALTRDGKTLYSVAPEPAAPARAQTAARVQVIDPVKMAVRKAFTVQAVPYDLAATDGGVLFLSGGGGDWTEVTAVDAVKETVLARWGGVYTRSLLQLTPNQDRLYVATQGVAPGAVEGLSVPAHFAEKPEPSRAPAQDKYPVGGAFVIAPDGGHLLCKNGTVLRLSAQRQEDLQPVARLEPFVAAAIDPDGGVALTVAGDGTLRRYSYPEFKLQETQALGVVAYQAVLDAKQGRLYVAGFDPKTLAGRPRARGYGDIYVYELKGPQARTGE